MSGPLMLKLLAILQAKQETKFFIWEFFTLLCCHAGPVLCIAWKGNICPRNFYVQNQWKDEKWEDQNLCGWMKLMETLGNWVYYCGGEELQIEKSGGNSYWETKDLPKLYS